MSSFITSFSVIVIYLFRISDAAGLGCDVTLDVDWGEIEELVKDSYDGRCGEVQLLLFITSFFGLFTLF